jgi:hypothetical protein
MELEQAIEKKAELEKKIAELLIQFTKETSLTIELVDVNPMRIHGKMPVTHYVVEVEARL